MRELVRTKFQLTVRLRSGKKFPITVRLATEGFPFYGGAHTELGRSARLWLGSGEVTLFPPWQGNPACLSIESYIRTRDLRAKLRRLMGVRRDETAYFKVVEDAVAQQICDLYANFQKAHREADRAAAIAEAEDSDEIITFYRTSMAFSPRSENRLGAALIARAEKLGLEGSEGFGLELWTTGKLQRRSWAEDIPDVEISARAAYACLHKVETEIQAAKARKEGRAGA
jgi:hypothetical protein